MSKETIALALSLGEQEPTLSAGWDVEESIGLRLIRELTGLREELALLRQEKLRTEMALYKLNHENDRLRAALAAAGRPLMLTDRGDPGDGYGAFYDSD